MDDKYELKSLHSLAFPSFTKSLSNSTEGKMKLSFSLCMVKCCLSRFQLEDYEDPGMLYDQIEELEKLKKNLLFSFNGIKEFFSSKSVIEESEFDFNLFTFP